MREGGQACLGRAGQEPGGLLLSHGLPVSLPTVPGRAQGVVTRLVCGGVAATYGGGEVLA